MNSSLLNIQKGDILLYSTKDTLFSRLVGWITKSNFSHVAMSVTEKTLIESNIGINTRIRPIDYNENFLILRPVNVSEHTLEKVISEILLREGTKYDYWRILGLAIRYLFKLKISHLFNIKERYICSELIDDSFYREGINLFPEKSVGDISPADFLLSPKLEVVGENIYINKTSLLS
jgi:hypothetical protein